MDDMIGQLTVEITKANKQKNDLNRDVDYLKDKIEDLDQDFNDKLEELEKLAESQINDIINKVDEQALQIK